MKTNVELTYMCLHTIITSTEQVLMEFVVAIALHHLENRHDNNDEMMLVFRVVRVVQMGIWSRWSRW